MARIVLLSLIVLCVLATWGAVEAPPQRGLFVSMLQDPPVLSSPREINRLLDFAKQAHIHILFVQIYHANHAWFPSKLADSSWYEDQVQRFPQLTLNTLIDKAHQQGIQVHAWINLLSLGENAQAMILKKYGPAILTRNPGPKTKLEDYKIDGQYFLEPGDPMVRRELTGIVREILDTYPRLDGLQFDYIRYPDVQPHYGYSHANVARFKQATGLTEIVDDSQVWKTWKRDQVTGLLRLLAAQARARNPHLWISTTGCMPYARAYEEAYQDWPSWLGSGLIDFVTLMDYSPRPKEFTAWIEQARAKVGDFHRVKIGIGAYKFAHNPRGFSGELRACEGLGVDCVIFHYGSVEADPELQAVLGH